jgi:predicted secreted protein
MAYGKGKSFLVKRETSTPGTYATVGGMKSNGMQINNKLIDVTDKDLPDWMQQISGGIKSMSLTLSGVMKDNAQLVALMAAVVATDGTDIQNFQLVSALGYKFQGPFAIEDFSANGDVGKEESYTLKLSSAGNITYTPA